MKKKIICLVLALAMLFSLAACTNSDPQSSGSPNPGNSGSPAPGGDEPGTGDDEPQGLGFPVTYDYETLYNAALGDFYATYTDAKPTVDPNERWAKMAVAEAMLLASGTISLTYSNGGGYAMGRVAVGTVSGILYGNDSDRQHTILVTNELIRSEDQQALRALRAENLGTGNWSKAAKDYLTGKGYTFNDTYASAYSTDPTTWDMFATSQQTDTEPVVQTYDGLMEYNNENILMPAMATEMSMSDDGLTYTFKIREGQVWVDSQGRKVADVKADDWVAGMQHLLDAKGGLQSLLFGIIAGAEEYSNGITTDFSTVGVKALDDYTLEYTLAAPCGYFTTMLGYSLFAPLSRDYFVSKGGAFGADYNASAASYTYGKTPNDIAYSGPYLVTGFTAKNSIYFEANPSYWNPDNVVCKKLSWLYNDGSDATKAYEDCKAGTIASCSINSAVRKTSQTETVDIDGEEVSYFDAYHYNGSTDATSFFGFYNLARQAFSNLAQDATRMVSSQEHGSADEIDVDAGIVTSDIVDTAARTHAALNNRDFRLALTFALDRGAFNAAVRGDDLKYVALINTVTPGTFVVLTGDATVSINGKSHTFAAGTNFGEMVDVALKELGVNAKTWDSDTGSSQGFDGWYDVAQAKQYMEKAIAALAADGVEVTAENPIYIDYVGMTDIEVYANQSNVYKQCIENAFDGKVVVNIVGGSQEDASWAAYQPTNGYEMNYDLSHQSGWGPDYGDPATYLDCFLPYGDGYMCKSLGLWGE